MQRVLCHGRAVAASMLRQEDACLPVALWQAPGCTTSHSLSSLAVLPMQHHMSQGSSLGAALICQSRLPFAAQVSPATLALPAYCMHSNPCCNLEAQQLLGQHSDGIKRRTRAFCDASCVY